MFGIFLIAKSTTPNNSTKNLHFSRISWIEIIPRLKKGGQPIIKNNNFSSLCTGASGKQADTFLVLLERGLPE